MSYANPNKSRRAVTALQRAQSRRSRRSTQRRAALAEQKAPTETKSESIGSAANTDYSPVTVGGNFVDASLRNIGGLLGKYGNNSTIANLGVGTIFDIDKTQAQTGLAIAYNDAFLGSMGNYQAGMEDLKTGNAMKLMGAEGAIARDLIGKQGEEQRAGIRETGSENRLNLQQQTLEERKLRADARGAIRSQGARFYG